MTSEFFTAMLRGLGSGGVADTVDTSPLDPAMCTLILRDPQSTSRAKVRLLPLLMRARDTGDRLSVFSLIVMGAQSDDPDWVYTAATALDPVEAWLYLRSLHGDPVGHVELRGDEKNRGESYRRISERILERSLREGSDPSGGSAMVGYFWHQSGQSLPPHDRPHGHKMLLRLPDEKTGNLGWRMVEGFSPDLAAVLAHERDGETQVKHLTPLCCGSMDPYPDLTAVLMAAYGGVHPDLVELMLDEALPRL